jgi:hypothetical protein
MDGINGARITIPQTYFDAARCARGILADAFRYLAMSWREPMNIVEEDPRAKFLAVIEEMKRPKTLDEILEEVRKDEGGE